MPNSSPRLRGAVRLQLQGATFTSLEDWRRAQVRIPSRSDAVRQLLERALTGSPADKARQTDCEFVTHRVLDVPVASLNLIVSQMTK
jgi:hypothetical protein